MPISVNHLKTGMVFIFQTEPYLVTSQMHAKTARSRAIVKIAAKNLNSRANVIIKLTGGVKVTSVSVRKRRLEFLYRDNTYLYFLDQLSYRQWSLLISIYQKISLFLTAGLCVYGVCFDRRCWDLVLPDQVRLRVVSTDPVARGNTVNRAWKITQLETGLTLSTPIFIKVGDYVMVNTVDGSYANRSSSK